MNDSVASFPLQILGFVLVVSLILGIVWWFTRHTPGAFSLWRVLAVAVFAALFVALLLAAWWWLMPQDRDQRPFLLAAVLIPVCALNAWGFVISHRGRRRSLTQVVGLVARNEYKPPARTTAILLATFFVVVLPAIYFSGMGYIRLVEHGFGLDLDAKSDGIVDGFMGLLMVFPIIPVMLLSILITGIPWMFVASRVLSWADIQFFTKQKGPRLPILSDWIDRLWLRMIENRRPESPTSGSSQ